jgi:hypothetical protein
MNPWTFTEDFETLNLATIDGQNGWYVTTPGNATYDVVNTNSPYLGTQQLKITAGTSGTPTVRHAISNYTNGTVYFSVKNGGNSADIACALYPDAVIMNFNGSSGAINSYDGHGAVQVGTFTPGTWVRIGIAFECGAGGWEGLSADTYKVSINGGAWSAPLNFYDPQTSVDLIFFQNPNSSGKIVYVDDISATYGPTPGFHFSPFPSHYNT